MPESPPPAASDPHSDADPLTASLRWRLGSASTLCEAAQTFTERFYGEFSHVSALVRVFVTLPLGRLPDDERAFVARFTKQEHDGDAGHDRELDAATPILTLLGTRGIEPNWSERTLSRDHRAIPLISEAFVSEAPMIARLLGETGFTLPGGTKKNRQFVGKVEDFGVFFVGDAATATDERGRRIIPSIDFVERYGIRSVFGLGAAYAPHAAFLTCIVFSRTTMLREGVARYVPPVREFMRLTRSLAAQDRIFRP